METPLEEREEFGAREIAVIVGLLLVSAVAGTVDVADDGVQDVLHVVSMVAGGLFWAVLVWCVYLRLRVRRPRSAEAPSAAERDAASTPVYAPSDGAVGDHP